MHELYSHPLGALAPTDRVEVHAATPVEVGALAPGELYVLRRQWRLFQRRFTPWSGRVLARLPVYERTADPLVSYYWGTERTAGHAASLRVYRATVERRHLRSPLAAEAVVTRPENAAQRRLLEAMARAGVGAVRAAS